MGFVKIGTREQARCVIHREGASEIDVTPLILNETLLLVECQWR